MRLGTIALSVFAAAWWIAGIRFSNGSLLYGTLPFLVLLIAMIAASLRFVAPRRVDDDRQRRFRLISIVVGIGSIMILAAVLCLFVLHATGFAASIVAMIVGLNALLLARRLPASLYYATGALMLALGASSLSIQGADRKTVFVSVGMALLLAATSILQLVHSEGWDYPMHDKPKGVE